MVLLTWFLYEFSCFYGNVNHKVQWSQIGDVYFSGIQGEKEMKQS